MNEKINLNSIKAYNEMREELYQWVRKLLNAKTGKEIPTRNIDYWVVSRTDVYVEYCDEDTDTDQTMLVNIEEFLEFVNKSK
jgi:hypothetical protein